MDYKSIISACDSSTHLISMLPVERVIEFGFNIGLDANTSVLDLCCGYGEMLRLWSEAFGISGVGVDINDSFISKGKARILSDRINLLAGDVLNYSDENQYDIVVCTELSTGLFENFKSGIAFLEKHMKKDGKLVFGRLFANSPSPPQELIDFDGELPTLSQIYDDVKNCGYYITAMASCTDTQWENYIMWSVKRDIMRLRQNPGDTQTAEWIDKWYRIYFDYRRQYEGWALFGVEKL